MVHCLPRCSTYCTRRSYPFRSRPCLSSTILGMHLQISLRNRLMVLRLGGKSPMFNRQSAQVQTCDDMAHGEPILRRVFITADNSVKAVYDDNSVLLLNSQGSTFTSIDQHGSRTTQLTLYALKRYHNKLAEVLRFRNLHVGPPLSTPLLCRQTHCLGYAVTAVSWAASSAEAAREGLLHLERDGSLSLDSNDHAARVVLHTNRCRLAVCYPLLVSDDQHGKLEYVWQTQLFAVWECPGCWRYPLALLQSAVQAAADSQHAQPQNASCSTQEVHAAGSTTQLPAALFPDTSLSALPKQSWWTDCSNRQPTDVAIKLEWTPEALYQFSPSTREVAVWIHADDSCLQSEQEGRFFRHVTGDQNSERLYAAKAVPSHSSTSGSKRLPLGSMANHATAMRQLCTKGMVTTVSEQSSQEHKGEHNSIMQLEEAMQLCDQVHEQHVVEGVGTFTAYQDGSVKVAFEDRALLYMDANNSHCTVIDPDGRKITVASDNAVGVEQYVAEAAEFYAWAFCSPIERNAILQHAASVQRELQKCQRTALLCEWAQGQTVSDFTETSGMHDSGRVHCGHGSQSNEMCADMPVPLSVDHDQLDPDLRQSLIDSCLANSTRLLSTLSH